MPAKNLYREAKEGIYSHIYNKGAEKRIIFSDERDYEVFLGFLKDYLTAAQDPESIKKSFTVHGRIFRGTPHQPKNYFNKVELIAYSLMPDHFHLLLHQKTHGSLESFIRSLCTRYSMYFNKKYKHTGALFEGPYKSVQIKDEPRLLHLTRYLHRSGGSSSYGEYLGTKATSWVKPKVVLSSSSKEGMAGYKDFVEKYEPDQKAKEFLEGLTFDSDTQHLERRDLAGNVENHHPSNLSTESSKKTHLGTNLKPLQRIPEVLTTTAIFLLLLTFGIKNIMLSTAKSPNTSATPAVLSAEKDIKTNTSTDLDIVRSGSTSASSVPQTVKVRDVAGKGVNIRQKPTVNSTIIGLAKNGDTFEFVSTDQQWYEVKLATGSGFISATCIRQEKQANEK